MKNQYFLTVLILLVATCLKGMEQKEDIKWTNALDYANYLKATKVNDKEKQKYIQEQFQVSEEALADYFVAKYYSKPAKRVLQSIFTIQYYKENGGHTTLFEFSDSFGGVCGEVSRIFPRAFHRSSYTDEFSTKNVKALLQVADECQSHFKKQMDKKPRKRTAKMMDDMNKVIDKGKTKFEDVKGPLQSVYDLPHPVREEYEMFEKNKQARKTVKNLSVREVCNAADVKLNEAYYTLKLGEAYNINTEVNMSEDIVDFIKDLLTVTHACGEFRAQQKE